MLTSSRLDRIIIRQFKRQYPNPAHDDLQQFGRALEWRTELRRSLTGDGPFPYVIQRQIEDELDRYQQEINDLADDLQTGEIADSEFQRRLRNLTIAILLLAFLRGSQRKDVALSNQALEVLRGGGQADIEPDYTQIPPEAIDELQREIETSILAAGSLGGEIMAGRYEDRRGTLTSRLAMWAATALSIYALGQLYRVDGETRMTWAFGPTVEHCADCKNLNGQVHTVNEWLAFFQATGKRPGSRALACGGWQCLCGMHETSEPASGEFVFASGERADFDKALKAITGGGYTDHDVTEEAE